MAALTGVFSATFKRGRLPIRTRNGVKNGSVMFAFLFCVARATHRSLPSCFVWQGHHSGPCVHVLCGKGNTAVRACVPVLCGKDNTTVPAFLFCVARATQRSLHHADVWWQADSQHISRRSASQCGTLLAAVLSHPALACSSYMICGREGKGVGSNFRRGGG